MNQEAIAFIQFCLHRLAGDTSWGRVYDEMCRVASLRLYQGWDHADLAEHGLSLSLTNIPHLRGLVTAAQGTSPRT